MRTSNNIQRIQNNIPSRVKLIVVTKHRSVESIEIVIAAGAKFIGENRVQEAAEKFPKIKPEVLKTVQRHLIGHLQTNKVKHAVELFDMIQSVDSLRLAKKINDEAQKAKKIMPILIQVNVANDPNKYGFSPEDVEETLQSIGNTLKNVKVCGLMAIVPYSENSEKARPHFKAMRKLFDKLSAADFPNIEMVELSIGMSNDYLIAISEGATMVRIGRAIFE